MKCIICDKEIEKKYYLGKIKNMKIVFCEKHKNYCDSCSVYSCEKDGLCKIINNVQQ